MSDDVLLRVRGLKKHYPIEKGLLKRVMGYVRAVDGVDFEIAQGRTLGLVGESGCGKTTLGRCVVRALAPTEGTIEFRLPDGSVTDLARLESRQLRDVRRHMHMIFQDPYSSLDPRMTVFDIIAEPLKFNSTISRDEQVETVKRIMSVVGLDTQQLKLYPHAFSGGQRQRIGIARSLVMNPSLVVCDEAVSALDVSVQAQMLNLLQDLQREFHLSYLFVAHDLSVVKNISDQVAVMYVGKIVELAETETLFRNPRHPYTEALLSAIPKANPAGRSKRILLEGEVANAANLPSGCTFHPRCRYAKEICSKEAPPWRQAAAAHFVQCHRADELKLQGVEPLSV